MFMFGALCLLHMVLLCQWTIEEMRDNNIKLYISESSGNPTWTIEEMRDNNIKSYISESSGNPTIKLYQDYITQSLQEMSVSFELVDISNPENKMEKQFMRENVKGPDTESTPLPPQLFNGKTYLGDFDDFLEAVEGEQLKVFLNMETKGA